MAGEGSYGGESQRIGQATPYRTRLKRGPRDPHTGANASPKPTIFFILTDYLPLEGALPTRNKNLRVPLANMENFSVQIPHPDQYCCSIVPGFHSPQQQRIDRRTPFRGEIRISVGNGGWGKGAFPSYRIQSAHELPRGSALLASLKSGQSSVVTGHDTFHLETQSRNHHIRLNPLEGDPSPT